MPIDIYEIENLFGNNGSYRVPNSIPTVFKNKQEGLKLIPTIYNCFGGTIVLTGNNGNGAIYEGSYYLLRPQQCLHMAIKGSDQRGVYSMVRCMGTNTVLTRTLKIHGDIATGNQDDLLEKNLHKCHRILESPADFAGSVFDLEDGTLEHAKFKPADATKVEQGVLSKEMYDYFKGLISPGGVAYRGLKTRPILEKHRAHAYVFGVLRPARTGEHGGKRKLIKKINEQLKNLNDYHIVQVTSPEGSSIVGLNAISYKSESIGSVSSSLMINEIDLSTLSDIKPLASDTLQNSIPTTLLNEANAVFSGLKGAIGPYSLDGCLKICRKADLPPSWQGEFFCPYKDEDLYYTTSPLYRSKDGISGKGQTIRFKNNNDLIETGYLYGLDRLDFLMGNSHLSQQQTNLTKQNKEIVDFYTQNGFELNPWGPGVGILTNKTCSKPQIRGFRKWMNFGGGAGYGGFINTTEFRLVDASGQEACKEIAHLPMFVERIYSSDGYTENPYGTHPSFGENLPNKHLPSYGFKLFQGNRSWRSGNTFKYLDSTEIKTIYYYSGIHKRNLFTIFGDEGSKTKSKQDLGCGNIEGTKLANLCNNLVFSKLYLYLYRFAFRFFVEDGYYYEYKNDYYDYYEMNKFLKDGSSGSSSSYTANSLLSRVTGRDVDNKEHSINDVYETKQKYAEGTKTQEQTINALVFATPINLPFSIKQGDYFFSSEDYELRPWDANGFGEKQSDLKEIKSNGNVEQYQMNASINTLGDFYATNKNKHSLSDPSYKLHDGDICIVGTIDGKIELRKFLQCDPIQHTLMDDDDQAVLEVDGKTGKSITYSLLQKLDDFNIQKADKSIDNSRLLQKALNVFYKCHDYIIDSSSLTSKFFGLSDDDLNTGTQLFDLVGTDGYCYLVNEKCHLIAKNKSPSPFQPLVQGEKGKFYKLKPTDRLKNLTLAQKINQVNTLYYKTHPISILGIKLTFTDRDRFHIFLKRINTENQHTMTDNFIFSFDTGGDRVERIISIPKKPGRIENVSDQIALDTLKLQHARLKEDKIMLANQLQIQHDKSRIIHNKDMGDEDMSRLMNQFSLVSNAYSNIRSAVINSFEYDTISHRKRMDAIRAMNEATHSYHSEYVTDTDLAEEFIKEVGLDSNTKIYITTRFPPEKQLPYVEAYREEFGVDCDIPNMTIYLGPNMSENVIRMKNIRDNGILVVRDSQQELTDGIDRISYEGLLSKLNIGFKVVKINKVETTIEYLSKYLEQINKFA